MILRQISAPVGVVSLLALGMACGAMQLGATDANLSAARSRAARGADLFASRCASCHGARGEGTGKAPAVMGAGALPVYPSDQDRATRSAFNDPQTLEEESRARPAGAPSREPFRTAADLERFVASKMPPPKSNASRLNGDENWQVVTFLLIGHGATVPKEGVTYDNAASVPIP
ncbi:MAG: cytochrome c [Polyangiaceae bacterium]|nr:cytochrome c [Polyangiaceae bacterium]